MGTQLKDRVRI